VHRTRRTVTVAGVTLISPGSGAGTCDVQCVGLSDDAGNLLGVTINFIDTTSFWRLQRELEHANQELATAYEELQSTREELRSTNEELQSINDAMRGRGEKLE